MQWWELKTDPGKTNNKINVMIKVNTRENIVENKKVQKMYIYIYIYISENKILHH